MARFPGEASSVGARQQSTQATTFPQGLRQGQGQAPDRFNLAGAQISLNASQAGVPGPVTSRLLTGYLTKRARGKGSLGLTNWKKRWFVLTQ